MEGEPLASRMLGCAVPGARAAALLLAAALLRMSVSAAAGEAVVTILHTADIHGHLDPVPPERGTEPAGGLLRCAAVVREIRARAPRAILLDLGDLLQGAPESDYAGGRLVREAVRAMGYDALVIGNHEMDGGLAALARWDRDTGIPVLAANLRRPGAAAALPNQRPFLGVEVDGVRVAIVGLTNPRIPFWSRPLLLGDAVVDPSLTALRRVLPAVRAWKPDVLVLAVHQGWREYGDDPANEIRAIARAFPDADLILGAHTHQAVERRDAGGVPYTQAGPYGLWLGEATLTVDTATRRVVRCQTRLHEVGAALEPDPEASARTADGLAAVRRELRREVGWAAVPVSAATVAPGQSAAQTLLAAAIAARVGADVVIHGTLSEASWRAGALRVRDVWRLVPYDNYLGVAHLTLDDLRDILEENSAYYGKRDFRGVYGLTYDLNPAAPAGQRVRALRLASAPPPAPDARLRVAFNSHDMASAGGRFLVLREILERPESRLEEFPDRTTRDAVLAFLATHRPLTIEPAPGARRVRDRRPSRAAAINK